MTVIVVLSATSTAGVQNCSKTARSASPLDRRGYGWTIGRITIAACPTVTLLLHKSKGVSGWVNTATAPSGSALFGGSPHRLHGDGRGGLCSCTPTAPSLIGGILTHDSSVGNMLPNPGTAVPLGRCLDRTTGHRRSSRPPSHLGGLSVDLDTPGSAGVLAHLVQATTETLDAVSGAGKTSPQVVVSNATKNLSPAPALQVGRDRPGPGTSRVYSASTRRRVIDPAAGRTRPLDAVASRIRLAGRKGMWQEALMVLRNVDPPNVAAYAAAIFSMGYNKKWQKAVSLLDEMELNGITPDESCYVTAIIACSKVEKFGPIMGLLDTVLQKGRSPSLDMFKAILASKRTAWAPEVLRKMREVGVQPDEEIRRLAMSAVVAGKDWPQTTSTWKQLTNGEKPIKGLKIGELNGIAKAFGGSEDWDSAVQVFGSPSSEWRASLPELNFQSYNYLVTAHANLGDAAGVLATIKDMEQSGHPADGSTYRFAFNAFARARHGRHSAAALEVFSALRASSSASSSSSRSKTTLTTTPSSSDGAQSRREESADEAGGAAGHAVAETGGVVVTAEIWQKVIVMASQEWQVRKAVSLLEESWEAGVAVDAATYDKLIFKCNQAQMRHMLLELVERAKQRGLKLSPQSNTWALVTHNRLGNPRDTLSAMEDFARRGVPLTLVGYNAAMHAAGELGLAGKALELFDDIKAKGWLPTCVSYTTAISACRKATTDLKVYARKSMHLLEEMESAGLEAYPPAHHVAISAVAAADGYKAALDVLNSMKARGIPLTGYSYSPFFKYASKSGDWSECFVALDTMTEAAKTDKNAAPDLLCFNYAISACASAHKSEMALRLMGRMTAAGLTPNIMTYTAAIDACAKSGWWQEAVELLAKLRSRGLEPNVVTYNAVIEACATAGQFERVMGLIDEMSATKDTRPTVITFSTALKACKNWEMAEKVQMKMRSQGVKPNLITYSHLIMTCGKSGDVQKALAQLDAARKDGLSPNRINYNCIVDVCAKSGEADNALALLEHMQTSGDPELMPDLVTYNSVINACAKAGDWALTLWLLSEIKAAGLKADIQSFNAALDACTKGSNPEAAVALLGRMRAQGLAPDAISYQSAISACRAGGDSAAAIKLMEEMERDGFSPGEVEYNLVIETVGRKGDWDGAVELLKKMKKDGVKPDAFSYSAAVGACGKGRNPEMARALLREMQELGHKPDRFAWNAAISAHSRSGDTAGAVLLMEAMKNSTDCDEATFASVMHGCAQTRDWHTAQRLLSEMRVAGFKPNDACYYALVSAASKAGELAMAEEFLTGMIDGVPPDFHAYSAVVAGCAEAGDWETAIRMMGRMKDEGVEPNVKIYTSALRACAGEVGQADVAWDLLEEMRRQGVERDVHVCTAAMEVFGRAGRRDRALALLTEMREDELELNLRCYNGAIEACARADDVDGGLSLLAAIGRQTTLRPNRSSFEQLIKAVGRAGNSKLMRDLRVAMVKSENGGFREIEQG